ncbi:hypothetical protein HMPREF1624_05601 [Sporothrix schenckii ATCC 58251]|uniref:NodB homology domain-containing protein n=1 Tax=Sporothrix schenckii (strain ATCC 58251 / de Perez 2211183) TaxID=1391915 RepID=U7PRU4_SPOS1|nr:hypothetical protein HMPREF1624_05601 [Sporothrix schenckii ATCC 58251]
MWIPKLLPGLLVTPAWAHAYDDTDILIAKRNNGVAAGGSCGTQANHAVCAAGLCCSAAGVCGTGGAFCVAPACQISAGPACDGNQTPNGADTSKVPRPLVGSIPYGIDISHCTVNGKVAITFDDGPYLYTGALLDILKNNNVTATFFVVGNNGAKGMINDPTTGYPAILRRMVADGHQIGSHTWSHQDLSAVTAAQRKDQIVKNEIALADVLGVFPTYLRPPYTRWNQDALNDLKTYGYHVLNYDIDTRDWQGDYTVAENIFQTILSQHSPASSSWISLEHDIYNTTVHVFAQYIIDQARKLGYQLVTVGECLADPPSNWYRNATTGQPAHPVAGGVANNVGAGGNPTTGTAAPTTHTTKAASPTTATGSLPSAIAAGSNGNGSGKTTTKTIYG